MEITLLELEEMALALRKLSQAKLSVTGLTVGKLLLDIERRSTGDQRDPDYYVITGIRRTGVTR